MIREKYLQTFLKALVEDLDTETKDKQIITYKVHPKDLVTLINESITYQYIKTDKYTMSPSICGITLQPDRTMIEGSRPKPVFEYSELDEFIKDLIYL